MDKPLIFDEIKIQKPNHHTAKPHEKFPPRYGTAPIRIKPEPPLPPWQYSDTPFTYANGKPLATLSNQQTFLIQNNDTRVDYSALATSQGWRADMFLTALLKYRGATIAQYPLSVVQCFCGSQEVFAYAIIDPGLFDLTDSVDLNYSVPTWARCT